LIVSTRSAGLIAALAVAATLSACKQGVEVGSFSVEGRWKGTVYLHSGADSVPYLFRLDLTQDKHAVDGQGAIIAPADSVHTGVSGTWDYPAVSLKLSAEGYQDIDFASNFTPRANRDTLRGPLLGSGFDGSTLTLVRQP
jgi:hypothetical protein